MYRYLDFKCPECGDVFEKFVAHTTKEAECECGATANKTISLVRVKGDPSCDVNWEKKRMKQIAHERKKEAQ
jgi:hypothetical protein